MEKKRGKTMWYVQNQCVKIIETVKVYSFLSQQGEKSLFSVRKSFLFKSAQNQMNKPFYSRKLTIKHWPLPATKCWNHVQHILIVYFEHSFKDNAEDIRFHYAASKYDLEWSWRCFYFGIRLLQFSPIEKWHLNKCLINYSIVWSTKIFALFFHYLNRLKLASDFERFI